MAPKGGDEKTKAELSSLNLDHWIKLFILMKGQAFHFNQGPLKNKRSKCLS